MAEEPKATHTPGPWDIVASANKNEEWPHLIIEPEGYQVAEVISRPIDPDTGYANAHLIAAAPELLEACKTVAASLHDPYCASRATIIGECNCYVSVARAAIAKATNEEGGEQ